MPGRKGTFPLRRSEEVAEVERSAAPGAGRRRSQPDSQLSRWEDREEKESLVAPAELGLRTPREPRDVQQHSADRVGSASSPMEVEGGEAPRGPQGSFRPMPSEGQGVRHPLSASVPAGRAATSWDSAGWAF